jgi:hypothetical protein
LALPKRPPARMWCRRAKRRHWRRAPSPCKGFPVADARQLIAPPHSGGSRYHHSVCACPITFSGSRTRESRTKYGEAGSAACHAR